MGLAHSRASVAMYPACLPRSHCARFHLTNGEMGAIADEIYQQLGEEGGNILASQIGRDSSQRFAESISGELQRVVKVAGMNEVVSGRLQRHILKKMEDSAAAVALCEAMRQDILQRGYAQVQVFGGNKMRKAMDHVLHALANMFEGEDKLPSVKDRWTRRETGLERAATRSNTVRGSLCETDREWVGEGMEKDMPEAYRRKLEVDYAIAYVFTALGLYGEEDEYEETGGGEGGWGDTILTSHVMGRMGVTGELLGIGAHAEIPHDHSERRWPVVRFEVIEDPSYVALITGGNSVPIHLFPGSHVYKTAQESSMDAKNWIAGSVRKATVTVEPYSVFIARADVTMSITSYAEAVKLGEQGERVYKRIVWLKGWLRYSGEAEDWNRGIPFNRG